LERRARRRRLTSGSALLLLLLAAGCGGGSVQRSNAAAPLPPVAADAGPPPPGETSRPTPADAALPDHCGGYAVAVAPILGRIARSAEAFLQTLGAARKAVEIVDAAAVLAAALDAERPALDAIHSADPALDAAHARLGVALVGMSTAVRALGSSYRDAAQAAARERASQDLSSAIQEWAASVAGIQAVCPGLE
jgi:hypothetical protein